MLLYKNHKMNDVGHPANRDVSVNNINTNDIPDNFASLSELDSAENEILAFVENGKTRGETGAKSEEAAPEVKAIGQGSENTTPVQNQENQENVRPPVSGPIPVNARRPLLKDELVANIMKLQDKVDGFTVRSKTYYTRKRVSELEPILADLMERGTNQVQGIPNAPPEPQMGESAPNTAPEIIDANTLPRVNSNMNAGSALFQFNVILAQFCEAVSINYEDKIGTNLKGFTEDIIENKKALEECLSEIYAENTEMLEPYMSGTNRYFLMMTSLGGQRLIRNKKKISSSGTDA